MIRKVLASALCALALLSGANSLAAELVDRIIAVVNEDAVMLSELRTKVRETLFKLRQAGTNPMPSQEQIINSSLDELILQKLQLAEARRQGIEADQELVAKAIDGIARNNNLSVPQLRQALAAEGKDFRQFQEEIRDQIIVSRLINREVNNRIQITTSEVDQYLAREAAAPEDRGEVNLLHILIATPDGASSQQIGAAGEKARQARARIDQGEDFRVVAQALSDGNRAMQGGDIGWIKLAGLPGDFAELVAAMQPGEVQGPFRSGAGFHLIKLVAIRGTETERNIVRQTEARHILIRTDEITADSDARARLAQLRERIVSGDDFGNLARSHSNDQASAIKGGELGWISPGNMVPEFEEVMDRTAIGDVSKPFKSRFGWHILQVTDRREQDETDQARRDAARKAIRERKAKEATEQYQQRLRGEAYIDLRLKDVE